MEENNKKTVGEVLINAFNKAMESYSNVLTDLFVHGPDIMNMSIEELKNIKNKKEEK